MRRNDNGDNNPYLLQRNWGRRETICKGNDGKRNSGRDQERRGELCYEYFLPLEEEETVLLIDSWENQKAIDLHHASPMMNTIMKLREKYDLHMRVERYVSDDGIPETDRKFIKN